VGQWDSFFLLTSLSLSLDDDALPSTAAFYKPSECETQPQMPLKLPFFFFFSADAEFNFF
jgi:hypothetical protein